MSATRHFDHVVVGSGSAGSVVARRLVDAGRTVALVEAGGPDASEHIHRPSGMVELRGTEYDHGHVTVPQDHLGGRSVGWPRGRVLGGSSSINGMIYVRGHRSDYDAWAYGGADGWSYEEVLPYFKRSENHQDGASEYHGSDGPLPVRRNPSPHPVSTALVEASVEAGLSRNDDHNGEDIYGVGLTHLNIDRGRRISSWRAFAEPVLDSGRLTVLTHALALRVVFEGSRAVGVEVQHDGDRVVLRSDHDVVLAAGALASPQLLQLSGIGPAEDLRSLGIDVLQHLPGVGENLHDHVISQVAWRSRRAIEAVAHPPLEVQLFADSRPGLLGPDLQPVSGLFAYPVDGYEIPAGESYTWFPGLVRPHSRGRLWLESADPTAKPLMDPAYLAEEADLEAMVTAIELCREIGSQRAMDDWNAGEIAPGPQVRTRAELREYCRRSLDTYFHPVGTCRMGVDSRSVVDPALTVYGVSNLRVADASVFPEIPSGNTHAPSVLVGERAAEFILEGTPS